MHLQAQQGGKGSARNPHAPYFHWVGATRAAPLLQEIEAGSDRARQAARGRQLKLSHNKQQHATSRQLREERAQSSELRQQAGSSRQSRGRGPRARRQSGRFNATRFLLNSIQHAQRIPFGLRSTGDGLQAVQAPANNNNNNNEPIRKHRPRRARSSNSAHKRT
jgi:hypothetical protein